MAKYINPYTDFGFKKLFGEDANKDLLIDFLNSILPLKNPVVNLTFRNKEYLPDNFFGRRAILDIVCTDTVGSIFLVEMQRARQLYFADRALFYTSFPIIQQAKTSDWDFKLNPVFFLGVLDFVYDDNNPSRDLKHVVKLKDENNNVFSDKLTMVFLQMPLFTKTESELVTSQDKWLYFLKNLVSFEDIPSILCEPVFEKAFKLAEYHNMSLLEQNFYQTELKSARDRKNEIFTSRYEGKEEGFAEGLIEGEIKGKAEGLTEGEIKGRAEGLAEGKAEGLMEGEIKGKAEGLTEGEANGKRSSILKFLNSRFKSVPKK
jgi:predicted transposase/invertase (TIGR01784 family)